MRQLVLVNGGVHTFLTVLFKISTYSRDYVISDYVIHSRPQMLPIDL